MVSVSDESISRHEGWQVGDAAFCQNYLNVCYNAYVTEWQFHRGIKTSSSRQWTASVCNERAHESGEKRTDVVQRSCWWAFEGRGVGTCIWQPQPVKDTTGPHCIFVPLPADNQCDLSCGYFSVSVKLSVSVFSVSFSFYSVSVIVNGLNSIR